MKKTVSFLLILTILSVAGAVSAHSNVIEKNGQIIANGASHPHYVEVEDGLFEATGFDAYADANGGGSTNASYGMQVAHFGPDQGTPGKADDTFAAYGDTRPYDTNPAIK